MVLEPKEKNRLFGFFFKKRNYLGGQSFSQKHALQFLNYAQFLGVVNDNVFKFLTLFFLIEVKGVESTSGILFWVGTIYVLPFLLFSAGAGVLADKISKQKFIVSLKAIEVVITSFGVLAFAFHSPISCYILLFLLAFHSAAFGPPKYSIIPELVEHEKISKANGIITSSTYLAMIVGTFLASFVTQLSGRNYALAASLCVIVAFLGFISSLFIPYTQPHRTTKPIKLFFLKEIYDSLVFCYHHPHLLTTLLNAAFFLFIGAFFQLNVIPYAIQALGLTEVEGGYLFLTVAIGIAIGSVLAGKISKNQVELGLSCCAAVGLGTFLLLMAILPKYLVLNLVFLVFIGVCGGLFIVPLDAYLQTKSPQKKRGQIIAASNFMSFCGVLLAPFSLYLFGGIFGLSAAQGFFIISIVTFSISILMIFFLSAILINYFGKEILSPFYDIDILHSPLESRRNFLMIMPDSSMTKTLLLAGVSSRIKFIVLRNTPRILDFFYRLFSSVRILYLSKSSGDLKEVVQKYQKKGKIPCLLLSKGLRFEYKEVLKDSLGGFSPSFVKVERIHTDIKQRKRKMQISFSDEP